MKYLYIVYCIIVILSCKSNLKEKKVIVSKNNDAVINAKKNIDTCTNCTKIINDTNNIYTLFYSTDTMRTASLDSISITDKKTKKAIQKIFLKPENIELAEWEIYFSIDMDINFDGYNDLRLTNYEGNYNGSCSYWLFNKKKNIFQRNHSLDNIYNLEIIKKEKLLCSKWHAGLSSFYLEKYFWENDSLKLKEKYEENWWGENQGTMIVTELTNKGYKKQEYEIKERVVEKMDCK